MSIRALDSRPISPPSPAAPTPGEPPDASKSAEPGPSPFARILHGIGSEVEHGEATVRGALSAARGGGSELGAGQLLALQAGVYRYSEAVDLAAKLVDRASTGVKTVIQGQ